MAGEEGFGLWNWIGNNANELKTVGSLVGGLGGGYGAIMQGRAIDKTNKLNLKIYDDEKKRQEQNDANLKLGFENSTFAK